MRSLKALERYTVHATDGDVGAVVDFLFDDEHWAIRHVVVETGSFFSGRRVLVSPISFREIDWSTRRFHLALTMDKVKQCPSIDSDQPVSRQQEAEFYTYYGYPTYWGGSGVWAMGGYPYMMPGPVEAPKKDEAEPPDDVHLRSAHEVRGYHVHGKDEPIGHIEDFLVDDETWELRYLVIDTKNWWPAKKVLVAPRWASRISWPERMVYVDLTRQAIKDSPEWNAEADVDRAYETRLHDHYGRPTYWDTPLPKLTSSL